MAAICGLVKGTCACIGVVWVPSPLAFRRRVYFGGGGGSKRRRGAIGRRRMLGNPADYAEFIPPSLSLSLSSAHVYSSLDRDVESRDPRHTVCARATVLSYIRRDARDGRDKS